MSPIGFKLPVGWREDPVWKELSSAVEGILSYLSEAGCSFIEYAIGSCDSQAEATLVEEQTRACARAGMEVALHPYFSEEVNAARFDSGPECRNALARVLDCATMAASITGQRVVVVFHPAGGSFDPARTTPEKYRELLMSQSRLFLAELDRRAASLASEVLVTIEHQVPPNPGENIVRIGDTYEELLKAVEKTSLPLCWDTGHYLRAVKSWGQPVQPPDEFVRRVAHVHLHDTIGLWDHMPITAESENVAAYVQRLWQSGFRGGVVLEYSAEGIEGAGGIRKAVAQSLGLLRQWAQAAAADVEKA